MRTTLKIETTDKTIELGLKLVDGKQIVELELSEFLALLDAKQAKTPAIPKAAKPAKSPKADSGSTPVAAPTAGAKRGRKPRASSDSETISEPALN